MRIKEAAEKSGLTEKAIRLYEEKGLISPTITEIAGRKFRDYDDNTVATLTTIAGLRRSFFSLEQIAAMQDSPERIPEIFATYRDELKEQYNRLGVLIGKADEILTTAAMLAENDETGLVTPEPLRDATALSSVMTAVTPVAIEQDIPHFVGRREEPVLHFKKWDEEIAADQRDEVYQQYLAYYARWEKQYGVELVWWNIVDWCRGHNKIFFGTLAALLLVVLALNIKISLPYQVEMDGYALVYAENPGYLRTTNVLVKTEPVKLTMDGRITYQLFHSPLYKGKIAITGYSTWRKYIAERKWVMEPNGIFELSVAGFWDKDEDYLFSRVNWGMNAWLEIRDNDAPDTQIHGAYTVPEMDGFCFYSRPDNSLTPNGVPYTYLLFPAETAEDAETIFHAVYMRAWYEEWLHWEEEDGKS